MLTKTKVYDTDLELGHIYLDNSDTNQNRGSYSIAKAYLESHTQESIKLSLLVDDYYKKPNMCLTKYKLLLPIEFKSVNVVLESTMSNTAQELIDTQFRQAKLKDRYYKAENKTVLFYVSPDINVPLKTLYHTNNTTKYSCPLLTMSWYLSRLGLVTSNSPHTANKLFNILEDKYKHSENQSLILMRATQYRECLNNIFYKFY